MLLSNGKILNCGPYGGASIPVKPDPLPDELKMKGFPMAPIATNRCRGIAFDGKFLWTASSSTTDYSKINQETEEIETFSLKFQGANLSYVSECVVADGKNIWYFPVDKDYVAKMNPNTFEIEKIQLPQVFGCYGVVYDNEYIWFTTLSNYVGRINPVNNEVTMYPVTAPNACSITRTEKALWITCAGYKSVVKVDLADMSFKEIVVNTNSRITAYDGEYLWVVPVPIGNLIKINVETEEVERVTIDNSVYGGSFGATTINSCTFDGKYLWLIPYGAKKLVRCNVSTEEYKGYDFSAGENMGNIGKTYSFSGVAYDGKNLWATPSSFGDRLVRIGDRALDEDGGDGDGCCDCIFKKFWQSTQVDFAAGNVLEVQHRLNLELDKAICDVRLQCVNSDAGYNVGDFIVPLTVEMYEWGELPARATLLQDKVALQVGDQNTGFIAMDRNGKKFRPASENWKAVFRVWYRNPQ